MISYNNAIHSAVNDTVNMPNPESYPSKFIEWAEDICIVLAKVYELDYEQVAEDLQECLGFLDE